MWQTRTLDELCEIARGGSPRPIKAYLTDAEDGMNWIKISDATASSKYIYETKEKIKPEGITRSRLVESGDFLLSNSMSFGRPYIMRTTGCIHDGWLVLRDKSGQFDQDYLYYFLGSAAAYAQFDSRAAGSTVRNLNIDLVRSVEVPLPPLREQRRIVAILDEAFEGIDKAIANTEQNLANAQEIFESYLEFALADIASGQIIGTLDEITDLIVDCEHKTAPTQETGIPSIRTPNISRGQLLLDDVNRVSEETFALWTRRAEPKPGDLIMAREAPAGNVGVVPPGEKVCLGQRTLLIRPNRTTTNPQFLAYYLLHPITQGRLLAHSTGATVQHVNMRDIRGLPVGKFPSIDEQKRRVTRLETTLEASLRLQAICQQKLDVLAELKQSILQKAFSGELTAREAAA